MDSLSGLIVCITGGGTGIGRAVALELAGRGCAIAILGRRLNRLEAVVNEIEQRGGRAIALTCDVTQKRQIEEALAKVVQHFGRLDIAIANAGFSVVGSFENNPEEEWRHQMDTNLFGVVWFLKAALPYLKKTKGRAAVISSVAGKLAVMDTSAYCASKHALVGLCNCLYQEWYALGVSMTNVLPGLIESEIVKVDNQGVFNEHRQDKRPKRFIWPAERAARVIVDAIQKRKREATITRHGQLIGFLAQHFPGLLYWLVARFSKGKAPHATNASH